MHQEKAAILLNPAAGKGKALRTKDRLDKLLRALEIPHDLFVTQDAKDLRNLTRESAGHYGTLVGAGGDSTFQIIVDEMMKAGSQPQLGLLGLGSSNDIAREFGLETLEKACLALKTGKTRKIDVGCVSQGGRTLLYFLGQANIGLGVLVNWHVESLLRRRPWVGKRQAMAGVLGILDAYRRRKIPLLLEIQSPQGTIEAEFVAAIFSNVRYWATGRLINPAARVDDGSLDACLIRKCPLLRLVRLVRLAGKGKHGQAGEVEFVRSAVFEVRSEHPFAVQADGEILGGWPSPSLFTEIQVRAIPQALELIC
ncbi:MAG: hypothetical protein FJY81_03000 [Candidatus Aminicenantes bacterium]|nr:hypothetical protein [Candidatus Aminicenantes bacterium]